jgi:type II secretory pathway pseudopilin PulG
MVEIAIALAVIGFALVAIIGVLPAGLTVQKENREETIINQDASIFLEAIRNGARGLDDLTNYVLAISNIWTEYDADTNLVTGGGNFYTNDLSIVTQDYGLPPVPAGYGLASGLRIVGLLSTPKYTAAPTAGHFYSNHVVAYVRAMSGSATEKFPQRNANILDLAFRYRFVPELAPLPIVWDNTNYFRTYETNVHELRLAFRWPLLPNNLLGSGRHSFRTLAGGSFVTETNGNQLLYFLQNPVYTAVP